jgi:anaerobic selenocysteine-containing dehydrogenase
MNITRRQFMRLATLMGGASLFAGCTYFEESQTVPPYIEGAPAVDPVETLAGINNVYSVCGLCPGNCGICCRVAQGTLVKIGGNPYSPIASVKPFPFHTPLEKVSSFGASVCAIGGSGIQTLYDPFRVAVPIKRIGPRGSGKWQTITWKQAIAEIVAGGDNFGEGKIKGLLHVKDSGEPLTFLVGRVEWGSLTFIKKFLAGFSGSSLAADPSILVSETARTAAQAVFGPASGPVSTDYVSARVLLSFGDAPLDSGIPLVSIAQRMADARIEGSLKWAVVDPRLSTSASKSDLWVPIIPGTDVDLALGILKTLVENHSEALRAPREEVEKLVSTRTIEHCADTCGLSPEYFRRLARMLAEGGPRSAVIPGTGILAQESGFASAATILALNKAVGSVPGTGGLTSRNDSFFAHAEKSVLGESSRTWTMGRCPESTGALIMWAADSVYSDPALAEKLKDPRKIPLVVAVSTHITETSGLADYILPDTTYLERWDICQSPPSITAAGMGVRVPVVGDVESKTGRYFPILSETMIMEDIIIRLATAMQMEGFGKRSPGGVQSAWDFHRKSLRAVLAAMNEAALPVETTPDYISRVVERGGVFAVQRTATAPKQEPVLSIDSVSPVSTVSASPKPDKKDEFSLITYALPFHRSPEGGLNSWLLEILPWNSLLINTQDARTLGIHQQERVVVETVDGTTRAQCRAMVVPGIRPGVVALARGFGYRGSGAILQKIAGTALVPDEPRGAGVNPAVLTVGKGPNRVRVRKT